MKILRVALFTNITPFTSWAYYRAAKAFLSGTDAAHFIEKGGTIDTAKLTTYHAALFVAALVGGFCALLLSVEIAKAVNKENS